MPPPIKAYEKFRSAMIAYEQNLRAIGRAESTISSAENVFKLFTLFMLEKNETKWDHEEGFTDIQAWRDDLIRQGKKQTTIKQYLKILSGFYAFASSEKLGENRWYTQNPVSEFLIPDTRKQEKRPYAQFLTDDQVMLLWRNNPPVRFGPTVTWARNYAIVIMLLSTELRNSELLALTPNDLDWEHSELIVEHGKGDKFRSVEFPKIAQTAVRLYLLSGLRPDYAGPDEPLFGTEALQKYGGGDNQKQTAWHAGSRQWLSELVCRHVKSVTGVDNIRTHDLRHVGARLDLNSGMKFEELQSKLGHESVTVTQIYSGKLTSRRSRQKTKMVMEEKERQANRNLARLEASGDDFFARLRTRKPEIA